MTGLKISLKKPNTPLNQTEAVVCEECLSNHLQAPPMIYRRRHLPPTTAMEVRTAAYSAALGSTQFLGQRPTARFSLQSYASWRGCAHRQSSAHCFFEVLGGTWGLHHSRKEPPIALATADSPIFGHGTHCKRANIAHHMHASNKWSQTKWMPLTICSKDHLLPVSESSREAQSSPPHRCIEQRVEA